MESDTKKCGLSPAGNPLLETSVTVDGELQKRIGKRIRVLSLAMLIAGAALAILYIVLSTLFETMEEEGSFIITPLIDGLLTGTLWAGAIMFVLGLIFYFGARANISRAKTTTYVNRYTFYDEYVIIFTEREGETISETKYYYIDFLRVRKSADLLLLYIAPNTAYAVDLGKLSGDEQALLGRLLGTK